MMKDNTMKDETKSKMRLIFSSFILSSLITLSACQQPTTFTPQVNGNELAEERALQDRMIAQTKANGGVPFNWKRKQGSVKQFERVAERLEKAGADVCREMGLPQKGQTCYFYFALSTGRDINAHADGRNVVVNAGMMHFVQNDDELAAVVGHELAHNLMRHPQAQTNNALMGALAGAMIDGMAAGRGGNTNGDFARSGANMAVLGYSSDFEREADYVGAYITARAGYNVHRATDFWRRMSVSIPDGENGGITHPSNPERVVALQKTIYEIDYKRKHRVPLIPDFKQ